MVSRAHTASRPEATSSELKVVKEGSTFDWTTGCLQRSGDGSLLANLPK